jgi:hypothetical protein
VNGALSLVAGHLALLMCVAGAACSSGSADDGHASSGVTTSKRLVDLTPAEKGTLCDWMVAKAGSYGNPGTCVRSEPAASYPFLAYDDQADCVQDSPDASFTDCDATVADLEACVSKLPACATPTDASQTPACASLSHC